MTSRDRFYSGLIDFAVHNGSDEITRWYFEIFYEEPDRYKGDYKPTVFPGGTTINLKKTLKESIYMIYTNGDWMKEMAKK